jgi:hypothetical protein
MASKSKASKARAGKDKKKSNHLFSLGLIPGIAFLIKLTIMMNIDSGGWLGADGESYLEGANGLLAEGYFSQKEILTYWPAGYPVLIWLICKISVAHAIWLISFSQSLFYGLASFFFVRQLQNTKLRPYGFLISCALAFNPTLSLSSLVVGYESAIASCMLMTTGLILKSKISNEDGGTLKWVGYVGLLSAISAFMQPRWIATSILIAVVWALMFKSRKTQSLIVVGVIGIMAIAPFTLLHRNIEATQKAVISTNLGTTMALGAGKSTSGGYSHTGPNVPCEPVSQAKAVTDNQLVTCVITWYFSNPVAAGRLFINKGWYFWSPWSGPLSNGTMARNPWLKINPISNLAQGSQTGNDLVYKSFGWLISFLWVLFGISLFFIGFFWLRSMKGVYANLAYISFLPVILSWLISMATIGDHRFRLPTMALSIFLQVIGYFAVRHKIKSGSFDFK